MPLEEIFSILVSVFTDYTLRYVALGSAVLGVTSGALGCFTVLRKQSLLGDAISHSALPGIAIAFLFVGSKEPLFLMLGAALFAWFGGVVVLGITNTTRIKQDAALGITLSVLFGLGIVLLTYLQGSAGASQGGLDRYLFGQAASLIEKDVMNLGILAAGCFVVLILFFKEFKVVTFDREFGQSIGFPTKYVNALLTSIIVVAIVIGLHTVGVVLMIAMLIAPAVSARQWVSSLKGMIIWAAVFGGISGVFGAIVSSTTEGMSTGPVIVLTITAILIVSLIFSPKRGYLAQYMRNKKRRESFLRMAKEREEKW